MLHGDLVAENIVWSPSGPVLIDWEFRRLGDPAEDLAYLTELNALPPALAASVLEGYGLRGMEERVEGWRALVAADAGAWYLAEGLAGEAAAMLRRARAIA
jgi:aminoglycoside phosphotransferase (APT) family kinase protein